MGEAEIDRQVEAFRKAPANDHSQTVDVGGASITQVGISEKSLIMFVWLPVAAGLLAAIAGLAISTYSIGEAHRSAYAAEMAERNAKLAQYQLEEAIKKLEAK